MNVSDPDLPPGPEPLPGHSSPQADGPPDQSDNGSGAAEKSLSNALIDGIVINMVLVTLFGMLILWIFLTLNSGARLLQSGPRGFLLSGMMLGGFLWYLNYAEKMKGKPGLFQCLRDLDAKFAALPIPILRPILWGAIGTVWFVTAVALWPTKPAGTAASALTSREQPVPWDGSKPLRFGLAEVPRQTACIEAVLKADDATSEGAETFSDVVNRMQAIDLRGCPPDFQEAYLDHLEAWEEAATFEIRIEKLGEQMKASGMTINLMFAVLLGDPFGTLKEIEKVQAGIQTEATAVEKKIRETFKAVRRVALRHGARLPPQTDVRLPR